MSTTARDALEVVERGLDDLEGALAGHATSPGAQTLRGLQVAETVRIALTPTGGEVGVEALVRAAAVTAALQGVAGGGEEAFAPPSFRRGRAPAPTEAGLDAEDERLRQTRMRLHDLTESLRSRWHSPRGEAACLWAALAESASPDVNLWELVTKALRASVPELDGLLGRLGRSFELELVLESSWPALTGTVLLDGSLQARLPAGGPQRGRSSSPRAQREARGEELEECFERVEENVEAGLPALLRPHASSYQTRLLTAHLSPLLAQLVRTRLQDALERSETDRGLAEVEIVVGSVQASVGSLLDQDASIAGFAPTPLREGEVVGALHLRAPRLWARLLHRRQQEWRLLGRGGGALVSLTPTPADLTAEEAALLVGLWRESENAAPISQILAATRDCLR